MTSRVKTDAAYQPGKGPSALLYSLYAAMLTAFVVAYFPVWKTLVTKWESSEDYSHCFLIVPICLYLVWRKRDVLARVQAEPSGWGLAVILLALMTYVFASLAEIATVASLSIVLLLAGVILYLYGLEMLEQTLFPVCFLLFMIPVPAQIHAQLTGPLQLVVSKASTVITSLVGIPVYREGNLIHLPQMTLHVVEACSGLRSMSALLALSALFAYLTLDSNVMRWLLFVSGIPIAIAVNVFRVTFVTGGLYWMDLDLTEGVGHTVLGMLLFMVALILLAVVKEGLSWLERFKRGARAS